MPSSAGPFEEKTSAVETGLLLSETWKRCVTPGPPGPLSLETLVATKMAGSRSPIPFRR
jgi:hypothetical protein